MALLDFLVQKGLIEQSQSEEILNESEKKGLKVEEVLESKGVDKKQLLELKGEYLNIPAKSLESQVVSFDILKYVPEESALHYKFIPISLEDGVLHIGIVDPDNIEARDALQFIASKSKIPFKLFLVSNSDFEKAVKNYKGLSGEVTQALSELETELSLGGELVDIGSAEDVVKGKGSQIETKIIEDAPVTKIVAVVVRYATSGNASDIHIEPMEGRVRVRFRVDGVLYTSLFLPSSVHSAMVARIKILANMRLDEKRKPQDSRFSARIDGKKIDFRVSTLPTRFGEKIVIRILDAEGGVKTLEGLGYKGNNLKALRDAVHKPYGLILITGPTGSGKSTTLYSLLNEIDKEKHNVISLEDPIEYNIEGVSQSQVKSEIGYTFASGLRSILRQDPDIIMVGEIRDKETAELAIQAALTGHLVFSTLHTNNAAGVVPRLVDMGIDPYLIAPTLIMTVAQRLTRMLCSDSQKTIPIEGAIKVMLEKQFADLPEEIRSKINLTGSVHGLQSSSGCPGGTRGRMAVVEVLEIDSDIERVILENPTEFEITKVARAKGMLTMKEDAILKSMEGTIPFEEVNTL